MSKMKTETADPMTDADKADAVLFHELRNSYRMVCAGCGSTMTDAELREAKKNDPKLCSCCPERKMVWP